MCLSFHVANDITKSTGVEKARVHFRGNIKEFVHQGSDSERYDPWWLIV